MDIDRRLLLGTALAMTAGSILPARPVWAQQKVRQLEKVVATDKNPMGVRSYVYTIVTPDIAASIHFYRDVIGYQIIDQGVIAPGIGAVDGVPLAGRRYVLLRHDEIIVKQRGVIRLLEAPANAKENRPRPASQIMDPGLAIMECHPHDWELAWRTLMHNNIQAVSPPEFYFGGDADEPSRWNMTWSIFGPAGEQMFVSSWLERPKEYWGLFGPFRSTTLMSRDRWPLWDFYAAVFGIKPADYDIYLGEETLNYQNVNALIGAPKGTYMQFGSMSENIELEWWEYRQWKPTKEPMWPTSLGRTGLAMMTMIVDNLATVRANIAKAKIPVLGEGGLPTPDGPTRDAVFIRGAVGELIEVIGRA